ncbi:MAG: 4-hydroxy-tetrahydrodipicolinate synthase [Rickettsiales bacterium]|nr:4-hydroxy-tetrahydrodipicolinate synthase [Rickettsiales bacterium]
MSKEFNGGAGVALITPMTKSGRIDWKEFQKLAAYSAEYMDFLVVLGTTAETPTLTDSEKSKLIDIALRESYDKPVVVGVSSNDTKKTVKNTKLAMDKGADAVLDCISYYNKPSQSGIIAHCEELSSAVNAPTLLYNVPGRTGFNIDANTQRIIALRFSNVIGVKEASNLKQVGAVIKEISELPPFVDYMVLSGNDDQTVKIMWMCANAKIKSGAISVVGNAVAPEMKYLVDLCDNHQWKAANRLSDSMDLLNKAAFCAGNPASIKEFMKQAGMIKSSRVRLPLVSPSAAQDMDLIKRAVANSRQQGWMK